MSASHWYLAGIERVADDIRVRDKLSGEDLFTLTLLDSIISRCRSAEQLQGAVEALERAAKLAAWIRRDRREPDKVLAYSQELAQLAARQAALGQAIPKGARDGQ